MRKLLCLGGLWTLVLATLLVSARPASAAGVERFLSDGILCDRNACNGKFPSANGCIGAGYQSDGDSDMVYRIASFQAYDPGYNTRGYIYYSVYCHAVFGEYITNDPNDNRNLGIYRMNTYGGAEEGYSKIAITGDGTYRTQMVGFDDNQAKICVGPNLSDSDPDFTVHDTQNPFPCTRWR